MTLQVGDRVVVLPSYGGRPPNLMRIPTPEVGDTAMMLPIEGADLPITIAFPSFELGSSVFVIPPLNLPGVSLNLPTIVPPDYSWWRSVTLQLGIWSSYTGRTYVAGDEAHWTTYEILGGFYYGFTDPDYPGDPIADLRITQSDIPGCFDVWFVFSAPGVVPAGVDILYWNGNVVCGNVEGTYSWPTGIKHATINFWTREVVWHL